MLTTDCVVCVGSVDVVYLSRRISERKWNITPFVSSFVCLLVCITVSSPLHLIAVVIGQQLTLCCWVFTSRGLHDLSHDSAGHCTHIEPWERRHVIPNLRSARPPPLPQQIFTPIVNYSRWGVNFSGFHRLANPWFTEENSHCRNATNSSWVSQDTTERITWGPEIEGWESGASKQRILDHVAYEIQSNQNRYMCIVQMIW